MPLKQSLPPPSGFATWLDYAVERFDTREPWLDSLFAGGFDDGGPGVDREQIRESARMELRALRAAALADNQGQHHGAARSGAEL